MAVSIRKAQAGDAPLLARLNTVVQQLHHEAEPQRFKPPQPESRELITVYENHLSRDDRALFIAEVDGTPAGYILCIIQQREDNPYLYAMKNLYIDQMSVEDTYQRQGVGSALITQAIAFAHEIDAQQVVLDVWHFNPGAEAFYRQQGFEVLTRKMGLSLRRDESPANPQQ